MEKTKMTLTTSEQNFSIGDGGVGRDECGAIGITVLLMDCNSVCLAIVSKMLYASGYEVVTATHAAEAMSILQAREKEIDLILTEIHLPDMDKYELLETMGEISSIPIVIMSADQDENTMLGCLFKGAAFYFPKPISMNGIKNLWQFSYMKRKHEENVADLEESTICEEGSPLYNSSNEESDCASFCGALEQTNQKGKRKEPEDKGRDDDNSGFPKNRKLMWTNELHHSFLQAIRTMGINNGHPKKILEHMNVPGLKKENISSHLQKYRHSVECDQDAIERTTRGVGGYHISPFNFPGETLEFQKPQLLMTSNPVFHVKNQNNILNGSIPSLGSTNLPIFADSNHNETSHPGQNKEAHSTCTSGSNGMKSCSNEDLRIFDIAVGSFGFEDSIDGELLGDSSEKQQEFLLPPLSPLEQQRNDMFDIEIGDFEQLFDMPTWSDDIF